VTTSKTHKTNAPAGTRIDLTGKLALITGTSLWIGAEVARVLHRAGARVLLNDPWAEDLRLRSEPRNVVNQLNRERPGDAEMVTADVRDPEEVHELMGSIKSREGGLDILVVNPEWRPDQWGPQLGPNEWRGIVEASLSGVYYCCRYGLEIMNDDGCLVSLGYPSAQAARLGLSQASAPLSGIQSLVRTLCRESARRGIRVNAVALGAIDLPYDAILPATGRDELCQRIPLGRFGSPGEVANAVLFLCSPLASYISGHVLDVDGGWKG
jgi:3-oxoacyl-[acyl-carrier protein] reductase